MTYRQKDLIFLAVGIITLICAFYLQSAGLAFIAIVDLALAADLLSDDFMIEQITQRVENCERSVSKSYLA